MYPDYKGAREQVSVRLGTDTLLKLRFVAASRGLSRHALMTEILEDAADRLFDGSAVGLAGAVAEERARRA